MINSVRFEREESCEHMQFNVLNESFGAESPPSQNPGVTMSGTSTSSTTNTDDSLAGAGNVSDLIISLSSPYLYIMHY